MVVKFAPSICHTKTVHALTALPSTCTTQAPHWDVSQPTCVPVSRRFSRRNCTNRVRGSTSPVTALPFTVSATADMTFLLEIRPKTSFFAPTGETGGGSGQNRVVLPIFCRPNGLHWQPGPRGGFDRQGIFPALANRRAPSLVERSPRIGALLLRHKKPLTGVGYDTVWRRFFCWLTLWRLQAFQQFCFQWLAPESARHAERPDPPGRRAGTWHNARDLEGRARHTRES